MVWPISGKNQTVTNATHIIETTRRATVALVEREERRTGSRMAAYEAVASLVGTSSAWIRKFIGRSHDVRADLVVGINILSLAQAYDRICTSVEQEAEEQRLRAAALRVEIHATFKGITGLVAELADSQSSAPPEKQD